MSSNVNKLASLAFFVHAVWSAVTQLPAARAQSVDQLYKNANDAYERGDVPKAIVLYEQLVKLQPNSVPMRTDLGVALAKVGRFSEAIAQYQEALKREPQNAIVQLNLALAWYKLGEFEKAATGLERLRMQQPSQQSLYLLADCYLRLGRNSDVATLLEPAYRSNPGDRAVEYALGTALIRQGQIQEGEAVIDRILRDGETPEANLLLGEAQFAAGDYRAAATSLHKALVLKPNLPEGWSLYGRALLNEEDVEGAKAAFRSALQTDSYDFSANLYLGAILRREKNNGEAASYLERALRLRPASPEAQFQVAALKSAEGKLAEARKEFERIESAWPDFLEVHVQLAALYARMNLKAESEREQKTVLQLNEKARTQKTPR